MAGSGRKVWASDEILAAADLQNYIQDQVVFVYANSSARSSGILAPTEGMVSYLTDTKLLYTFDGSAWVEVAPNVGTAGTYTKVTTDAKGRVTSGTTLSASDIPSLDASKITSGSLSADRIPALDSSKVTTGNFDYRRVTVDGGDNIITWANAAYAPITGSTVYAPKAGGFTFSGTLGVAGDFSMGAAMYNGQVYNQTNTGRAVYVASNGLFGIGSSSERFKKNIVDADIDIEAVRQILVRNFEYKKSFGGDGSVQVGVIAEELVALGLSDYVFFDNEGQADGVAYEKLALLALSLAQVQADRVDAIEARLSKLEGN